MAEEKVLETNSLRVEERSPWYDFGKRRSGSFTQDYATSRQQETGCLFSFAECSSLQQVTIDLGSNDGGRFGVP